MFLEELEPFPANLGAWNTSVWPSSICLQANKSEDHLIFRMMVSQKTQSEITEMVVLPCQLPPSPAAARNPLSEEAEAETEEQEEKKQKKKQQLQQKKKNKKKKQQQQQKRKTIAQALEQKPLIQKDLTTSSDNSERDEDDDDLHDLH
jgi:flagellar biosynthesis component FlhA